jgi:hypothetical protein
MMSGSDSNKKVTIQAEVWPLTKDQGNDQEKPCIAVVPQMGIPTAWTEQAEVGTVPVMQSKLCIGAGIQEVAQALLQMEVGRGRPEENGRRIFFQPSLEGLGVTEDGFDQFDTSEFQPQASKEEMIHTGEKSNGMALSSTQTGEYQLLRETFQEIQQQLISSMTSRHNELVAQMQQQHSEFMSAVCQQQEKLMSELVHSNQHLIVSSEKGNEGMSNAVMQLTKVVMEMTGSLSQLQDHARRRPQSPEPEQRRVTSPPKKEIFSENSTDLSVEERLSEDRNLTSEKSQLGHKHLRSIPFCGKEKWKVWHTRFEVSTKGWSHKDKLEEMLLLLRGTAAEFVFDQMPSSSFDKYSLVVKELENRFRKIENPRIYRTKLSELRQRCESVEEFAVKVKMVYNKAYPGRDIKSRKEDLLQKFMEGLKDQHASSQVQFIKQLEDIDEAVDAVINFQELHAVQKDKRSREHYGTDSCTEGSEGEGSIAQGRTRSIQEDKDRKLKSIPSKSKGTRAHHSVRSGHSPQLAQKHTETSPQPRTPKQKTPTRPKSPGQTI